MPFSPISLFFVSTSILAFFIAGKILTQDYKIKLYESIYLVIASLITAIAVSINRVLIASGALDTRLIEDIVLFILLFMYFWKVKSYPIKKTCTLVFLLMLAIMIFEISWESSAIFFSAIVIRPYVQTHFEGLIVAVLYVLGFYIIFIPSFVILVKLSRKLRATINNSDQLQFILANISMFCLLLMQLAISSWRIQGYVVHLLNWNTFFLFGFIVAMLVSFYFYTRSLKTKLDLQLKEAEQKNFHYYIQQIEQQQTAMRKFKHDYQNILLSFDSFLEDDDLPGLKHYYLTKIKTASDVITKSNFALEELSKIKIKEIKGILVAKLMLAQNLGIDTVFEADEEIDYIPMDSISLIRMIGIIMDNAIEELEVLGEGKLLVGCFNIGTSVNFVVQNTCRPEIPPIHQLKQSGFSTKGKGRGLGLDNLSRIADSHPNTILLTSIKDGNFIQKLVIGDGDEA